MSETMKPPYTVRQVRAGPGESVIVHVREDNGAYLTDDEVKVWEYVRHLEKQLELAMKFQRLQDHPCPELLSKPLVATGREVLMPEQ